MDKQMEHAEVEGNEEEQTYGVEEVVNEEKEQLEESVQGDGTDGESGEAGFDTVDNPGTMWREIVDVLHIRILQACKVYMETVTTTPTRDLRSMCSCPSWMQPTTADPHMSPVEAFLRCCMAPENHRANIMVSMKEEQHVQNWYGNGVVVTHWWAWEEL